MIEKSKYLFIIKGNKKDERDKGNCLNKRRTRTEKLMKRGEINKIKIYKEHFMLRKKIRTEGF